MPGRSRSAFFASSRPHSGGILRGSAATAGHQQRRSCCLCHANYEGSEERWSSRSYYFKMKRFLLAAAFFAVLVLLWEAAYRAKIWSPVLLPSPRQVVSYLEGAAADGTLAKATVITMRRLLVGYFIGLIIGLPLGLLTARWKVFADTIGTLALGLQTLPSVCWVPLALLWFGQTEAAMLFVVVMGTLWSVV